MDDFSLPKPRLRLRLDHFSAVSDARQSWRVDYPLREVLFLVVCGTIANSDDYDDIVEWGEAHLDFLRGFSEFHHGIPCVDWLRTLLNRVDPDLFSGCFGAWVAQCWPQHADRVAIDGKTSRRSHDRKAGRLPLHLISAFATNSRLVLGQEGVDEKSNETTAIPALLERLDLTPEDRPWSQEHGPRQALRPQHRPTGQGQACHQTKTESRFLEPPVPHGNATIARPLTWTRCGAPRPPCVRRRPGAKQVARLGCIASPPRRA